MTSGPLIQRLTSAAMIVAGLAIAIVFGGGLLVFLWEEVAAVMRRSARPANLMALLLMGPIVGVAPALLGLALVRRGGRRWRLLAEAPAEDEP